MSNDQKNIIESMKGALLHRVEEWLGFDIPKKGEEDYDVWQSKIYEIECIEDIIDVCNYLDSEMLDADEFFIDGEYNVISAGFEPNHVSLSLIKNLGDVVAEGSKEDGSNVKIYCYDGMYFVINGAEVEIENEEDKAFKTAKIVDEEDSLNSQPKYPLETKFIHQVRQPDNDFPKIPKRNSSTVLITVPKWPSGPMAIKFGYAIRSSLGVSEEDMVLVQMSPERIFRVETNVSETEFREAMKLKDVAATRILFAQISRDS